MCVSWVEPEYGVAEFLDGSQVVHKIRMPYSPVLITYVKCVRTGLETCNV
jgi:hypothetical protein